MTAVFAQTGQSDPFGTISRTARFYYSVNSTPFPCRFSLAHVGAALESCPRGTETRKPHEPQGKRDTQRTGHSRAIERETSVAKTTKKTTSHSKNSRRKPSTAKESHSTAKARTARSEGKKPAEAASGDRSGKSTTKPRTAGESEVTIDRRRSRRRINTEPVSAECRKLERREKVTRRRQIDPTTCERDYSDDEVEFMSALDNYKRASGRMFPTCSEILEVIRNLGYSKSAVGENHSAPPLVVASQETSDPDTTTWCDECDEDTLSEDVFACSETFI